MEPQVVKYFCEVNDIDLQVKDGQGRDVLWWACAQYRILPEAIHTLIKTGTKFDVNHRDKEGNTCLKMYLERNEEFDKDVIQYILDLGFDLHFLSEALHTKMQKELQA